MACSNMVGLRTVASPFEAKLLAARLGAEGIVWELRGSVDGPYPTGPVYVFVEEDSLPRALDVIDLRVLGPELDGPELDGPESDEWCSSWVRRRRARRLLCLFVAALVAVSGVSLVVAAFDPPPSDPAPGASR